jgi:hypothetical protein
MELTRSLIDFLDAHEFGSYDLADIEYISDKVDNYFENFDMQLSIEDSMGLAEQYSNYKQSK